MDKIEITEGNKKDKYENEIDKLKFEISELKSQNELRDLIEEKERLELKQKHQNQKKSFKYSSKSKRFLNYVIDYIAIYIIAYVFSYIFGYIMAANGYYNELMIIVNNELNSYLFAFIIFESYYIILEGFTGRTIGKFLTGSKVIPLKGTDLSFSTMLARSLSRLIPFEIFSFLGDKPSGWHDTISGTIVVDL